MPMLASTHARSLLIALSLAAACASTDWRDWVVELVTDEPAKTASRSR
jgi:hypothetical protein